MSFYWLGKTSYRLLFSLTGGVRTTGTEHLPETGAFLICANHASLLDPPLVGVVVGRTISYLAKKELFQIPVLGAILPRVHTIPVDRARMGKDTISAILRKLKQGMPVLVFPEGTRSKTGRLGSAKAGGGFLARIAGVPVVPTYLQNTRLWPKTWSRARRIGVHFGPVLSAEWISDLPRDRDGYQKIAEEILGRIRTLQDGLADAGRGITEEPAALKTLTPQAEKMSRCPNGQI